MTSHVIDASLVAAAVFREDHADEARRMLQARGDLHVPDLLFAEFGNVIWKRVRNGDIDRDEAAQYLVDVRAIPFVITPLLDLVDVALPLALQTGRTVYDALYLALALQTESVLLTCDLRLVNALSAGPFARHVRWIGH